MRADPAAGGAGHLAENAKQVVQLRWTTITYR